MNNIFTSNDFYKNIIYFIENPHVRNKLSKEATQYCQDNLNVSSY